MNGVMGLIEDLLSPEIRPNSPEVRPAESRANVGFSPHSPVSPIGEAEMTNQAPAAALHPFQGRAINDAGADPLPDPAAEARRQRVLAMLAERPGIGYAVLTDIEADPDAVILALATRSLATCELRVPREKWDGVLFLELLDR